MSDFLGRLAARSLGTMPGVDTRPQPLFAPAPEPLAPLEAAQGEIMTPKPLQDIILPTKAHAEGEQPPLARSRQTPARPAPGEPPAPVHSDPRAQQTRPAIQETPQPLVRNHTATAKPPLGPIDASQAQVEKHTDTIITRHVTHDEDEQTAQINRTGTRDWMPLVPGHRPPPGDGDSLSVADLPPATQPAEPAIHISIGRVEVRAQVAAHPAPVARPRPQPRTGLSLEDYLKRGGGGS